MERRGEGGAERERGWLHKPVSFSFSSDEGRRMKYSTLIRCNCDVVLENSPKPAPSFCSLPLHEALYRHRHRPQPMLVFLFLFSASPSRLLFLSFLRNIKRYRMSNATMHVVRSCTGRTRQTDREGLTKRKNCSSLMSRVLLAHTLSD